MKRHGLILGRRVLLLAGWLFAQLTTLSTAPLPNAWQITDNSPTGGALNYATNLPAALHTAAASTTGGFDYAVNARFVPDFGGTKALFSSGRMASMKLQHVSL